MCWVKYWSNPTFCIPSTPENGKLDKFQDLLFIFVHKLFLFAFLPRPLTVRSEKLRIYYSLNLVQLKPCFFFQPMFHEITVHSTSISSVLFTSDDQKLITCGENDYCIAQWSVGCNSDTRKNNNNALKRSQSIASQSQRENNEDE